MGFLDLFDSPNFLSTLLGGSEPALSGGANGAPPLPPAAPAAPPPAPTPTPPAQGLDLGSAVQSGSAWQNGAPIAQGFDNSLPVVAPSGPAPTPSPAAPPVPLPQPRPQFELPPNATTTVGATAGSPLAPSAPPMPPAAVFDPNAAPPAATGGGLRSAFGLNPTTVKTALAGMGRGLSAVGQMRPGTTAGAAFAGGMGGALQGSDAAQNQLFNQSSTAFKDMLAAENAGNTEGYRQAQAQYLHARAQSLLAGGTGSGAWPATPYGKVIQVENEAQKYEKGQQILLQKRWTLNGASPDQQQKDLDQLSKNVETYRKRLYKSAGVDPDKADKLRDMGISKDNPFDTKGMTLDQFHSQVPMGAWYKDQNGDVRQRTVAPPQAGGQQGAATTYDDMAAMQPAA